MGEFEDMLLQHPLWATRSQEAQESALDALEHYVMTRLHKRIFAPDIDARRHDAVRQKSSRTAKRVLEKSPIDEPPAAGPAHAHCQAPVHHAGSPRHPARQQAPHPAPHTLHLKPCTLRATPLHLKPYTLNPTEEHLACSHSTP